MPADGTTLEEERYGSPELIAEATELDDLHAFRARYDAAAFASYVLRDEETAQPVALAPMHEEWHALADRCLVRAENPDKKNDVDELGRPQWRRKNLLIWAMIEAGKTQAVTVARALWEIGRNPNIRILIVMNTDKQAQKIASTIGRYIMHSPEFKKVFPSIVPAPGMPWNTQQLSVQRTANLGTHPTLLTCGIHGNVLGSRVDLLFLDDILDYENTRTDYQRKELGHWVRSTPFSRLTRKARVICVGTAWERHDLMHELSKQEDFVAVKYPAMDPVTEELSWPERWPRDRIESVRVRGIVEFNRTILCTARSDEESRFKQEWINACLARGRGLGYTEALKHIPDGVRVYTGVDLGVSQKKDSDLTCLFTIAVLKNGDRMVLDVESGRWDGPTILKRAHRKHFLYQSILIVEGNGCFAPGTRVLTPKGYVPIETVKVGDLVWTHKGRWQAVTATHEGWSGTLTTARAKGCLPVTCTPNHWFYMRRAGRTSGREGGYHRPVGDAQWISYGLRNEPAYTAVARPQWPALAPELHQVATLREPTMTAEVDERLALMLGLFMAEGHTTRGQVSWTLNQDETYLADLVVEQARRLTSRVISTHFGRGTLRVTVNSTRLANTLRIGTRAEKCLPLEWLGWPLKTRLALVRGWLLGDGCVTKNNQASDTPSWSLGGPTISRNWALFVRSTLADAGLFCTMRRSSRGTSVIEGRTVKRSESFVLSLSWSDAHQLRQRMTSPEEAERWKVWFADERTPKKGQAVIGDGVHAWSRVPEIERHPYHLCKTPVYNLTVKGDRSFTVEDFIVHNAQDFIVQFSKKKSAVPIRSLATTGQNKHHPEFGLESMAIEMEMGKWIIPCNAALEPYQPAVSAWIEEMLFYDPNGHTGDHLMASWKAREGLRTTAPKARLGTVDLVSR